MSVLALSKIHCSALPPCHLSILAQALMIASETLDWTASAIEGGSAQSSKADHR
jgi:hypothetical protein